ncbi:hypothetical protein V5799_006230 [Amblyomma americanum]|uniref:Secreted protein n=1 Tax=Amblyomma americanum TaxID=6943 RepID=A0AAQ4DX01_AMBAM
MHENRSSSKKTTMLSLFLVCLAAVDIALTAEEKTEESRSQFDVFCDFGSEDRKKLLVCISSASNQAKTLLSKQGRSIESFASEVCKQNKEQFPQDIQNHLVSPVFLLSFLTISVHRCIFFNVRERSLI